MREQKIYNRDNYEKQLVKSRILRNLTAKAHLIQEISNISVPLSVEAHTIDSMPFAFIFAANL